MAYVEYDSNNSGGDWWLDDADWFALEKAGWVVVWNHLRTVYSPEGRHVYDSRGIPTLTDQPDPNDKYPALSRDIGEVGSRWLGALAKKAYKPNCDNLRVAVDEWERITGKNATDAGCPCCGVPHTFTVYDDAGKYVKSGPSSRYSAEFVD